MVLSMVGNALQRWIYIRDRGKARKVKVEEQPVEVVEGKQVATMDNIKVLHHRLDGQERRLADLETSLKTDKREIVEEIIKIRDEVHKQLVEVNRSVGRLEGSRIPP